LKIGNKGQKKRWGLQGLWTQGGGGFYGGRFLGKRLVPVFGGAKKASFEKRPHSWKEGTKENEEMGGGKMDVER